MKLIHCPSARRHACHGPNAPARPAGERRESTSPNFRRRKRSKGIGQAHIAITTKSTQAQEWFDQGLALLHCFWDYEAERAFEEAVRLDPDCAMCHWGLFQALDFSGDHDQAKAELARAKELAPMASDREQRYIRAIERTAGQTGGRRH